MGDSSERPEVYLGSKRDTWQDALVRIVSALILVAVIAMLAVQLAGRSTNPQETIKLVPNFKISEAGANAHPTVVVALPTVEGGAPVRFERDADGYRLYADKGVVYYGEQGSTTGHWSAWVGPARLLVTWLSVPFDGPRIHEAYVLNLDSGLMEHLPGYKVHMSAYAWQDGSLVGLLDLRNDEKHPRVLLSDLESGAVYTVYDADAKIAQWAGEDVHPKSGDFSFEHGGFTWLL